MKKFLVGLVLDSVFNALISTLERYSKRSASKVDDKLVQVLIDEGDDIKADLLNRL